MGLPCLSRRNKMRFIAHILPSIRFKIVIVTAAEKNFSFTPKRYYFSFPSTENVVLAFALAGDLPTGTILLAILSQEHFPPPLSRNLSQNTSFSFDIGCDFRSVLKHVSRCYDIFSAVHDNRVRVVGLIYTKLFES